MLILQGTTALAVPSEDARTPEGVMREAGNTRVTLETFPGSPRFLETLSAWLARTLESGANAARRGH